MGASLRSPNQIYDSTKHKNKLQAHSHWQRNLGPESAEIGPYWLENNAISLSAADITALRVASEWGLSARRRRFGSSSDILLSCGGLMEGE